MACQDEVLFFIFLCPLPLHLLLHGLCFKSGCLWRMYFERMPRAFIPLKSYTHLII